MRWRVLKVSRYINIKDAKNFEYTSYFEDDGTEVFLTSRHLSAEELFSPFFFDESRR